MKFKNKFLKLIILTLIFSFAFYPIFPAFAQIENLDTITPATDENPPAINQEQPLSEVSPENPSSNVSEPENPEQLAKNTDKPIDESSNKNKNEGNKPYSEPNKNNGEPGAYESQQPSGYSIKQGIPEIDKNTGALNYSFPIYIPPGRNNFQPQLVLSYNSNQNSDNSAFGYGWSVSIPYIQLLNKNGVNKLYGFSDNYFYSSLDGELVKVNDTLYIPKTENGSFNKYVFSNNYWIVLSKDGTEYRFGLNDHTKQNDPSNPGAIYKWMIQEIKDTNDNFISFDYLKNEGQIYPLSIKYTGNGQQEGIFEVKFSTEQRPDNITKRNAGFPVATNYRINEITTFANNDWKNKYTLTYEIGGNGVRSVLSSITESAKDQSQNIIVKPSTIFSYSPNPVHSNIIYDLPAYILPHSEYAEFADINGDGFTDVLMSLYLSPTDIKQVAYLNNKNGGWIESEEYKPPKYFVYFGANGVETRPHSFSDINGDSLLDLIFIEYNGFGNFTKFVVYMNTGSGWLLDETWFPQPLRDENATRGGIFIDINGDGLDDFIPDVKGGSEQQRVFLNTGTGFTENTYIAPKYTSSITGDPRYFYLYDSANNEKKAIIADINADGVLDIMASYSQYIVSRYEEVKKAWLGDGKGNFNLSDSFSPPILFSFHGRNGWDYSMGVKAFDYNNDGLTDLLQSAKDVPVSDEPDIPKVTAQRVFLNTGSGWAAPFNISLPYYFSVGDGLGGPFTFGNFHGKGINEIYKNTGELHTIISEDTADLLNYITQSSGGNMKITYKPSTVLKSAEGNFLNPDLPVLLYVVSKIETLESANIFLERKSYQYSEGTYYYNGAFDRNIAGFAMVEETDMSGNVSKFYYHTSDQTSSALGEYQDNYFKLGKAYRIEKYDNSENIFQKTINKWDSYNLENGAGFVKLIQTISQDYDGLVSHKDRAESYEYDNNTGNQITKTNWGEVLASDDSSFADVGTDKIITNLDYTQNYQIKFISKPSNITVFDQNNKAISKNKYYYDNLPIGNVSLGNLTKEEKWVSGEKYINIQNKYNNLGLVTESTDANGNITNYLYDNYGIYPETATNALGQTTQYAYDYGVGKVIQITDANGNIFKNTYDGFGRMLKEEQPSEDSPEILVVKNSYIYNDARYNISMQANNYLDSSNVVAAYNYYDYFGRLVQTKKSAEDNNFTTKDFIYDNRGNLQKESLPYFSNTAVKTAPTETSQLYVIYSYDALNRKISENNVVGATFFTFSNWQTTITDANGNQKNFVYDAYNNLIQVKEHNGQETYVTFYEYDALNNLTNITDALGNVRNFTYDALARRLTANDLHNPSDLIFGTWSYFYDNNGNIISLINPKGEKINYAYDALNRKISENYIRGIGTELTLDYDFCLNGIGRLCRTISNYLTDQYEYSASGNVIKNIKKIRNSLSSKTFSTEYAYDRQANQTLITNPDQSQVKYEYNQAGLVERIFYKKLNGNFDYVIYAFDYAPTGQITDIYYKPGAWLKNTYDQNHLYRLTKKLSVPSANGVGYQDISYQYDAVGNMTKIIDNSVTNAKKTVNYVYDNLYRLTSAVATGTANNQDYSQNFVYDAIGNILKTTENGIVTNYIYDYSANPHAVIKTITEIIEKAGDKNFPEQNYPVPGQSTNILKYDASGNVVRNNLKAYGYDYNNRLVSVKGFLRLDPGNILTYYYDAQGQRVGVVTKSDTKTTMAYYPTMYYNASDTDGNVKHIFLPAQAGANGLNIATIEGSGTVENIYYNLPDHLASSNVVLNSSDQIVETTDYYPFGKIRLDEKSADSTFTEQRKYIGQEFDQDTGLNYLNARYYNSNIARFMSQDPMFWSFDSSWLADPQNQNSYSYARNNPITNSDPSGKEMYGMSEPVGWPVIGLFGGHTTQIVDPSPGEILYLDNNCSCRQVTEPTTFAGYTEGKAFSGDNWRLVGKINAYDALSTYKQAKESGLPHVALTKIDATREGMTEQQFDQRGINNMVAMQGDLGPYNPMGGKIFSSGANCHNTFTTALTNSGVSQGQINEIGKKLSSENNRVLPGIGNQFNAPSAKQIANQKVSNTLNSIGQALSSIINKIFK